VQLAVATTILVKGGERDNGEGLPQADREVGVADSASGIADSVELAEQQTDRLVKVAVKGESREVEADQA
jgi:hypothetical protein